ncbi:MAG: hypothetical protein DRP66_04235 [Planctomycetota bacterium]|nr:MAG: hypothetical protein DRP66_04235 [Planctomycetota bacterium]
MSITKPILNTAAYAIILLLILLMGLALLKTKGSFQDSQDSIDAAGRLARANKEALANIDAMVDKKIAVRLALSEKKLEGRISGLQTRNLKLQQQLAGLQRKVDASAQKGDDLKWYINPKTRTCYALIPFGLPWHPAKQYAATNGGHLVVINDKEENDWLVKTFGADTEYWTGLTDEAEEGKWTAVNGEEVKYFNWAAPEPDNYRKNQHYVIINSKAPHLNQTEPGKWNDVPGNEIRIGIIEKKVAAPRTNPSSR